MTAHIKLTARSTIFLLASLTLLLVIGIFVWNYRKPQLAKTAPVGDQILGQIGRFLITENKIKYQMAINQIMIPKETDRSLALKQVQEMYTFQTLMEKHSWVITDLDLMKEDQRIKQNTRSPHIIQKIREIKDFDPTYYREIFVKGTLVRRLIFNEFYFSRPELHRATESATLKFAQDTSGKSFEKIKLIAAKSGFSVSEIEIDPALGFKNKPVDPPPSADGPANPPTRLAPVISPAVGQRVANDWFKSHMQFKKVKTAMVFDQREHWTIFFPREFNPEGKRAAGLLVTVPKQPFHLWLKNETAKGPLGPSSGAVN